MAAPLKLISHKLCPYVQRAVIALTEKGVPFERIDIDLANKPDWFLAISPLGKTPVLLVGDSAIFESAVILEYLEETQAKPLHPADPLCSMISRVSTLPRMKPRSRPRPRNSNRSSRGSKPALRLRHGSTAKVFRWWMRCSARCSGISMCSTRSPISAFCRASRSSRAGARISLRGHRCARQSARITRRCCAILSSGGIRGCRVCRNGRRLNVRHARPCAGHPRLPSLQLEGRGWPGRSPAMTKTEFSGLGGHFGECRNRVHVARGPGLGGGNDELRRDHALIIMDVDLAGPHP